LFGFQQGAGGILGGGATARRKQRKTGRNSGAYQQVRGFHANSPLRSPHMQRQK
jgi:hypothetical protein